jgi:hypothetical protein
MSNSVHKKETLSHIIKTNPFYGEFTPHDLYLIKKAVEDWLKKERVRLFIPTVSTMDCELSGVVDDTFEELLGNL